MSQSTVSIQMSQSTVEALLSNGFSLYAFKAVSTSPTGAPLVWQQTQQLGQVTSVTWTDALQAYVAQGQIMPFAQIRPSSMYPVSPGSTLQIVSPDGTGNVTGGGPANGVAIANQTHTQLVCGLAQQTGQGRPAPVCALPLFGMVSVQIVPVQKVLLFFSPQPMNPGTVVEQAPSPGILVDLTGATSRTVTYDINAGWSWSGPWAQSVAPGSPLGPLLIG